MTDWDDVVAFACALPDVTMESFFRTLCPKVNGKAFVSPGREAGSFCLLVPIPEKEMLLETDPDTFWETPHYQNYPAVLVRYGTDARERIELYIQRAWWDRAKKPQRERFGPRP